VCVENIYYIDKSLHQIYGWTKVIISEMKIEALELKVEFNAFLNDA